MDTVGDVTDYRTISYVRTVVKHAAIDIYRRRKRGDLSYEELLTGQQDDCNVEDLVCAEEGVQRIVEAIADMSEDYREVLSLHYLNELSPREIADVLHRPYNTVRSQISRGRKALQKTYLSAGERTDSEETYTVVTKQGFLYQCHPLTQEEQQSLDNSGAVFRKAGEKTTDGAEIYHVSDRDNRQFVLLKDAERVWLGKFVAYTGGTACNLADILQSVMGIYSSDDIRSVTFERSVAVSREDPDKLAAVWTNADSKEWFYQLFSGHIKVWYPYDTGEWNRQEMLSFQKKYMPITYKDKLYDWKNQVLKKMPEQAFYLQIENRRKEALLLGLLMKGSRVELWMEPLEEIKCEGQLQLPADDSKLTVASGLSNAVVCLPEQNQRELAELLQKML